MKRTTSPRTLSRRSLKRVVGNPRYDHALYLRAETCGHGGKVHEIRKTAMAYDLAWHYANDNGWPEKWVTIVTETETKLRALLATVMPNYKAHLPAPGGGASPKTET